MSNTAQSTTSKKAVFFLGAGFSKAVIPSFPLLPELSKEIEEKYHPEKGSIQRHFDFEVPKQYKSNIEHLLTFLSSNLPFKTTVQISADDALYKDLKNFIAQEFEEMTYNFKDFSEKISFCRYLDKYKIPCITLNYDLLLEELFNTYFQQKGKTVNNFEYFYHSPVSPLFSRQIPDAFGFGDNTWVSKNEYPIILKLHGSINWLCAGISQTDPVYCKTIPFNPNDEYLTKDLQPMIVPPVMDKTSIYNHTILKAVWRQAYEKLKEAEEIYICGFSFPETDLSVRFLFQSALTENENLQKIYFINTGNDLENKKKHFIKAISGLEINHSEQIETIPRSTLNFIRGLHSDKIEINFKYCCEKPLDKFIDEIIAPQVQE